MSEPIAPSPVHRSLIAAARERPDRCLVPPERVRGRACRLLAQKLVGLGLAEKVTVDEGETVWWVEADRGPVGLRLPRQEYGKVDPVADADAATESDEPGVVEREAGAVSVEAIAVSPPAEPRAWTKIAWVLALLRRPQGADLQAVVEATGWLPHTARAALTGLRRKGYAVEARKQDDAGGRTVYRIAPAAAANSEAAR